MSTLEPRSCGCILAVVRCQQDNSSATSYTSCNRLCKHPGTCQACSGRRWTNKPTHWACHSSAVGTNSQQHQKIRLCYWSPTTMSAINGWRRLSVRDRQMSAVGACSRGCMQASDYSLLWQAPHHHRVGEMQMQCTAIVSTVAVVGTTTYIVATPLWQGDRVGADGALWHSFPRD